MISQDTSYKILIRLGRNNRCKT